MCLDGCLPTLPTEAIQQPLDFICNEFHFCVKKNTERVLKTNHEQNGEMGVCLRAEPLPGMWEGQDSVPTGTFF